MYWYRYLPCPPATRRTDETTLTTRRSWATKQRWAATKRAMGPSSAAARARTDDRVVGEARGWRLAESIRPHQNILGQIYPLACKHDAEGRKEHHAR